MTEYVFDFLKYLSHYNFILVGSQALKFRGMLGRNPADIDIISDDKSLLSYLKSNYDELTALDVDGKVYTFIISDKLHLDLYFSNLDHVSQDEIEIRKGLTIRCATIQHVFLEKLNLLLSPKLPDRSRLKIIKDLNYYFKSLDDNYRECSSQA